MCAIGLWAWLQIVNIIKVKSAHHVDYKYPLWIQYRIIVKYGGGIQKLHEQTLSSCYTCHYKQ